MKNKGNILIIDDDEGVLHTAKMILKPHFQQVKTETSPRQIKSLISQHPFDLIILDMNFSTGATDGKEGLQWLREIKHQDPDAHILVNTAYGDIQIAVDAMKEGAIDFLTKPWEKEKLLSTVQSIMALSMSKKEARSLRLKTRVLNDDLNQQYENIVSRSPAMLNIFKTIDKIAITDANVLILGENGTGKELIARAIHQKSLRKEESFIKVDLGAISENLFESELFGHTKGAYTDAKEDRVGRLEIASGGSLFLDEVGNISASMQAKLLTVLQNREVTRVGANKSVPIDIRLICATNMPIYEMVNNGEFRQDLLYRINTVEIMIPPLRKRKEDIPLLAAHYIEKYAQKYKKRLEPTGDEAMAKLVEYDWPGNIRELQHSIERAVILCEKPKLTSGDFLLKETRESSRNNEDRELNISILEKEAIEIAIDKHSGNFTKAAEELGLGRTTLYRKMKRYGLWVDN